MRGSAQQPSACRAGQLRRMELVTKRIMRAEPHTLFVFGDNMVRAGYGGQAAAMRGEPNALGVPTKWRPGTWESDYFCDADWNNLAVRQAIDAAFDHLEAALAAGRDVVLPSAGLGTGRAQLAKRAPRIAAYIGARLARLSKLGAA